MNTPPDEDDANEVNEMNWLQDERRKVEEYLACEGVDHLGVGEYPAFHFSPCLALWAVQSKERPGWVGWWAISGDLPTDYISRGDADHPRKALAEFARVWGGAAERMIRGEADPNISIGPRERWPELGDLLRRRAQFIGELAADDEVWEDDELE